MKRHHDFNQVLVDQPEVEKMIKPRVMAILLDGAPYDVFYSLAHQHVLPNVRKLMEIGSYNLLYSTIPPVSPVAIPSLLTGRNPGKHGMFGFGYLENGFFRPYTSANLAGETLWDILAHANKRVILLNVPWTFPAFKVNGIMISGPPLPRNKAESYPAEIVSILESKIGRYYPDLSFRNLESDYEGSDEDSFLEEAYRVTRRRAEAMYYLMGNYEWDLFFAVFTTLDRMQHVFFGYFDERSPLFDAEKRKILIEYYKEIDNMLGETISLIDENTFLMIVSDHGFSFLNKHVGMNNMLVQGGFAKETSNLNLLTTERILGFLERIGLGHLRRVLSLKIVNKARTVFPTRIDYSRSEFYSLTAGTIAMNKNRIADEKTREALKERLISFLYSVKDPKNGERIVEKVYNKTEIYRGNRTSDAPDLIAIFKNGYEPHIWRKEVLEPVNLIMHKTVKTGTHQSFSSRKGIFIVSGPDITKGSGIKANLVDIAPTILHVLDVPISPAMDGKVLTQIFKPRSRLQIQQVKFRERHLKEKALRSPKDDEKAIKERLRKLGYI